MTCDAIRTLLDLEDVDARVDRAALRGHLATCAACAARWPEVAALLGVPAPAASGPPIPRARARRAAGLAAAAALLAFAGRLADPPQEPPPPADGAIAAAEEADDGDGRVRWLPASVSRVERSVVRADRGRTLSSTLAHAVLSVRPAAAARDLR